MQEFIPKLKDHLLGRILDRDFDGDTHEEFTDQDRNTIRIINNRIYSTQIFRVNYTTYDVRRDQDVLNPRTQPFVMMHSPETEAGAHPYWYAQILGVFNATVKHDVPPPARSMSATVMEFLWVRWLGVEPGYRAGIRRARLPKVGFVPESDPFAFGFLDPARVIRASHPLPDFSGGRTNSLLATEEVTAARLPDDTEDWANYYINMCGFPHLFGFSVLTHTHSFADRDMLMRYLGGGIGHLDVESLTGTEIPIEDDNEQALGTSAQTQGGDSDPEEDDDDSDSSSESEEEEEGATEGQNEEEALDDADDEMDIDGDGYAAF